MDIDPRERLVDIYNEIREISGDATNVLLNEGGANWAVAILTSTNPRLTDLLREAHRLLGNSSED